MDFSKRQRLHDQLGDSSLRKSTLSRTVDGRTPSRATSSFGLSATSPQSPAVRASPGVLANRRILDRPQGPSSRVASSTFKNSSSLGAATPRSIFKSSVSNGNHARFTFSPRVPPNVAKESFPPATPGRSLRASAVEISGRSMAKTTSSTNLFNMRIPSPDPELDGEALAKQVPDDPGRVGSVYADEFLAHLCPPGFDDLQRRQFFCILDLRRLKYAANDVFAKKDWKLNIMNFAKEYEKSRSLIMLRYGLYEFKTVPVSSEVMKQWKSENNIPAEVEEEEEPIEAPTPRYNGTQGILARPSNKRRAEDDLTKDTALTASSSNQNKRRVTDREPLAESTKPPVNAATPAKSNKRAAQVTDEVDENQPHKMQKPMPSATKSLFESVANNTSPVVSSTTPAKSPAKNLFGSATTPKPASDLFSQQTNGTRGSVLDGGFKLGGTGGNIFGHLSDAGSARGSGNEGADADEESEGEGETDVEEESEVQEASQSDEHSVAASGGIATPSQFGSSLFSTKKPAPGAVASGTSSEAGDASSSGPSLFDRVTIGKDGEPVRVGFGQPEPTAQTENKTVSGAKRAASPVKENRAPPSDKTWNPDTPIKFTAPSSGSAFGSAAIQPSSIFGKAPTSATSALQPKKIEAHDFASASTADKTSAPVPSLFPAASSFGPAKKADEEKPSPAAPISSMFGAASTSTESASQLKPLFGATPKAADAKPMFGTPQATSTNFGVKFTLGPEVEEVAPPEPKGTAGGTDPASAFGAPAGSQTGASKTFTFGGSAPPPADLAPKTAAAANGATDAASVFGATSNGDQKFAFGSAPAQSPAPAPKPLFGSSVPASEQVKPQSTLFGSASTPVSEPPKSASAFFGAPSSTPSTGFNIGSSSVATPAFSGAPSTSFNFGQQNGSNESSIGSKGAASIGLNFGNNNTATPSAFPSAPKAGISFGQPSAADAPAPTTGNAGASNTGFNFSPKVGEPSATSLFGALNNSAAQSGSAFGGGDGAASSFTFPAGGSQASFKNPFSQDGNASATPSFNFGGESSSQGSSALFAFGAGGVSSTPAAPSPGSSFMFTANSQASGTPAFGATNTGGSMFNFSASSQPANPAGGMFAAHLGVPTGGTSTGTNTPLFGGASSLATTPATGTPEPETKEAKREEETQADEDGKPQEQISLTSGGPGEEDEDVVHEVRAKALKFSPAKPGSDDEATKDKSPWQTQGVGALRLLKHKTTGAVRMLLRAEPRGHLALNRAVLPNFEYKVEKGGKYVKVMTANDDGSGLETWMLQVKTNEAAQSLAAALEANKSANKN